MKLSSLLAVAAVATVAGIAAGVWFILSEIGAERIWQLVMIAVLAGLGIGFVRVLLSGLAKIAEAKKVQPAERHLERHTVHTIDNRPQAPPALPAPWLQEPNPLIFPAALGAAWKQGMSDAGQSQSGEVIDGEAKPAPPARQVWH